MSTGTERIAKLENVITSVQFKGKNPSNPKDPTNVENDYIVEVTVERFQPATTELNGQTIAKVIVVSEAKSLSEAAEKGLDKAADILGLV